jgi:hypothetical protein
MAKVVREGFWTSEEEPDLPMPEAGEEWPGQENFLSALCLVEDKLEPILTKGFSVCRICTKLNGSMEYELKGWRWPSGYLHYLLDHHVKPSSAFVDFILGEVT